MSILNLNDEKVREKLTYILRNWRQNSPAMIEDILSGLAEVAEQQKPKVKKQRKANNTA